MKTENINFYNNFGWNSRIHKKITVAALERVPFLPEFRNQLLAGVAPKRGVLGFICPINPDHCYRGEKLSHDIYYSHHSLDLYEQNLQEAVVNWEFDNCDMAICKLGKALHVLQDVANPIHTYYKRIPLLKINAFQKYDKQVSRTNIENIISGSPQNATTDNVYDLFGDTYKKSLALLNPLKKENADSVPEIIHESLSNACYATVAFLKRLTNLHSMSDAHKTQAIANESFLSSFLNSLTK